MVRRHSPRWSRGAIKTSFRNARGRRSSRATYDRQVAAAKIEAKSKQRAEAKSKQRAIDHFYEPLALQAFRTNSGSLAIYRTRASSHVGLFKISREQLTAHKRFSLEGPLSGAFWLWQCSTKQIFSKGKSTNVEALPSGLPTRTTGNFG